MVKAKSDRTPQQPRRRYRAPGLDTSQLLFLEDASDQQAPPPDQTQLQEELRTAQTELEEARACAERANLVAESTRAAARTARKAVEETLAAADRAESEAIEAGDIAKNVSAAARTAEARLQELRARLAPPQARTNNRVSAWIEYPRRKSKSRPKPDTAARPRVIEAARVPKTPPPAPPIPRARKKLVVPAGYEIVKQLEDDELGVLCLARQVAMDRLVQLKLLHVEAAEDRELVEQFLREARTAGKVNHPNLMRIHAAGRAGRQYYYSAEHIEGRTLEATVADEGSFAPARACQVARALASGLAQWEKHGLLHGGLNPARVVESNSGDFKLMGLGLSRRGVDLMADLSPAELSYVAPEMILDESADSRADVFSVGALLYFLLTAKRPHGADNRGDVVRALREEPTVLLNSMRGVSKRLAAVVGKAMRPAPADRFELMSELIKALDAAVSGSKIVAAASERLKNNSRRRRR
jgi:Protein kinase domain